MRRNRGRFVIFPARLPGHAMHAASTQLRPLAHSSQQQVRGTLGQ
jgi:hypothetical protein